MENVKTNRESFVRHLHTMISVYFGKQSFQKHTTLAEFLADDMRDLLPEVMQAYLKED